MKSNVFFFFKTKLFDTGHRTVKEWLIEQNTFLKVYNEL